MACLFTGLSNGSVELFGFWGENLILYMVFAQSPIIVKHAVCALRNPFSWLSKRAQGPVMGVAKSWVLRNLSRAENVTTKQKILDNLWCKLKKRLIK